MNSQPPGYKAIVHHLFTCIPMTVRGISSRCWRIAKCHERILIRSSNVNSSNRRPSVITYTLRAKHQLKITVNTGNPFEGRGHSLFYRRYNNEKRRFHHKVHLLQWQVCHAKKKKKRKKKGKADLTTVLHIRELPHLHLKIAVWFSFPTTNNKNPMIPSWSLVSIYNYSFNPHQIFTKNYWS